MAETAIAYSESGVGKTSICISLAKFFYQEFKLTTRLISSEGWEPIENDALITSGIVSAFNISTRPKMLADMRKLSKGYWPKILEEDVPVLDASGMQTGFERKKVRRIVEDKAELAKVGLYFIETMDGISDRFMSHIIKEEVEEYSDEKRKMVIKSVGPQGSSGRYVEDGEVFGGNSEGHYNIVQTEMQSLATAFGGLGGGVKLVFWTSHVGTGKLKGEPVYAPLVVGEAKNAKVPAWMGECFHLEEIPRIMDENGNQLQDKQVKAYYESHRETGLMEGPRFLCKSRVGFSDLPELQEKFPGGSIPLGIREGEGLDQYYRWLYSKKGANKSKMMEWKRGIDSR